MISASVERFDNSLVEHLEVVDTPNQLQTQFHCSLSPIVDLIRVAHHLQNTFRQQIRRSFFPFQNAIETLFVIESIELNFRQKKRGDQTVDDFFGRKLVGAVAFD